MGSYLWGLSFAVHMSSIFLSLAIAYLIVSINGFRGLLNRKYLWAIGLFILAITLYAYIPIRASSRPFLNWSNPDSWQGFINHITGWQYRVWMFNSVTKMFGGIKYFGQLLYTQFGLIGGLFIVIGLVNMFRNQLKLAFFFALIILADVIYSSNYEIYDIESYYLLAIASFAIFAAYGVAAAIKFIHDKSSIIRKSFVSKSTIIICLMALPLIHLISNYPRQDKSRWQFAGDGVQNILASMEPDGLAFIDNWDFYSPWLYLRYVQNIRPDAILIDKELLRRSWYLDFLQRYHPDILQGSQSQIADFLEALKPFESAQKFDPPKLTQTYEAMINSIISNNISKRPVYTNFVSAQFYNFKQEKIPVGVVYRLEDSIRYIPFDLSKIDISSWETTGNSLDIREKTALAYVYRAAMARTEYCRRLGYETEARSYADFGMRLQRILDNRPQ